MTNYSNIRIIRIIRPNTDYDSNIIMTVILSWLPHVTDWSLIIHHYHLLQSVRSPHHHLHLRWVHLCEVPAPRPLLRRSSEIQKKINSMLTLNFVKEEMSYPRQEIVNQKSIKVRISIFSCQVSVYLIYADFNFCLHSYIFI